MPTDPNLTFRRSLAETQVSHLGVVSTNAATGNLTEATYTSSWIDLGASLAQTPWDGLALYLAFAASGFTSTGATGTASLVAKLDFGDDGSNSKASESSQALLATFASSASPGFTVGGGSTVYNTPVTFKFGVANVPHRYVRLTLTTTLVTITAAVYGLVEAWLDNKGRTAPEIIEIG
jgi:hypothetical protein